jgi:hypothetical protein
MGLVEKSCPYIPIELNDIWSTQIRDAYTCFSYIRHATYMLIRLYIMKSRE